MNESALARALETEYALNNLEEIGHTDSSTLFRASNMWGTTTVEVELFTEPLGESGVEKLEQINASLEWLDSPALQRVRSCGVTDDGQLYVVRDLVEGERLRQLIDARSVWGTGINLQEAAGLLWGVATTVDQFADAGHADLLARSLDLDALIVQQSVGAVEAPVKMRFVGPATGVAPTTKEENLRSFADLFAAATGTAVDGEVVEKSGSAQQLLQAVVSPQSQAPTVDWAQPVTEQPATEQKPQQYFPDTDETPAVTDVQEYSLEGAPEEGKKRTVWPWVLAAILLIAAAGGGGGYWWWQSGGLAKDWEGVEAEMASDLPKLIAEKDGGRGFEDMRCRTSDSREFGEGKIRCANSEFGVSIYKMENEEARNAVIPESEDNKDFEHDGCKAHVGTFSNTTPPVMFIAPEGDLNSYFLVINGPDAEKVTPRLPLC